MQELINFFLKFPGVGQRQARRFVFHLLNKNDFEINSFIEQLKTLRQNTKKCTNCFYIFTDINNNTLCETCRSPQTNKETIIVVEKNIDVEICKKREYITEDFLC